jgi:hypothetical protein
MPKAQIIHNFGRAELVDRDALARLVRSISSDSRTRIVQR